MRYQQALIAWIPDTDQIRVGPLLQDGLDWARHPIRYTRSGGAKSLALRRSKDKTKLALMLFIEFQTIVVRDRVPAEAVHKAFLTIDEYRARIAPDISGANHDGDALGGWR